MFVHSSRTNSFLKDSKEFRGELFGITNLFRDLSDKLFTSNIVGAHDKQRIYFDDPPQETASTSSVESETRRKTRANPTLEDLGEFASSCFRYFHKQVLMMCRIIKPLLFCLCRCCVRSPQRRHCQPQILVSGKRETKLVSKARRRAAMPASSRKKRIGYCNRSSSS